MDKSHILDEIRRTTEANGGQPLGISRFEQETGITRSDWYGKLWARWGDVLTEAGYEPNPLQGAYPDEFLLDELIDFIRELGHFPVAGELRLRTKTRPDFPSHNVFSRLGRKSERISLVIQRCEELGGLDDVRDICLNALPKAPKSRKDTAEDEPEVGFVYLIKSGKFFKIGRSNSPSRREYELAIQLPEEVRTVHMIRTDDPAGIESYWHRRFADRRKNGEWFELTAQDVRAFKRRKVM